MSYRMMKAALRRLLGIREVVKCEETWKYPLPTYPWDTDPPDIVGLPTREAIRIMKAYYFGPEPMRKYKAYLISCEQRDREAKLNSHPWVAWGRGGSDELPD